MCCTLGNLFNAWLLKTCKSSEQRKALLQHADPVYCLFRIIWFCFVPASGCPAPTRVGELLRVFLPDSAACRGITAIYRNWSFAIFYILAEMWGSMVLSMMFWGFANDITKISEAKRFYGLLGIGANLALIFSGRAVIWAAPGAAQRPFDQSLQVLMLMVFLSGLCILGIYAYINRKILVDPSSYDPAQIKKKKAKTTMTLTESFTYLSRSKYIGCIAFIVLAYGVTINLIEVIWKSQLKLQYATPGEYTNFMGHFSEATGIVTLFMFVFVSHNVIRRFGWTIAALITPIVLMTTGALFLNFIVFREALSGYLAMMGTSPLMMAVIFGAAQNIMSKSSKYSLFDPTKEMSYIPLDEESKIKGKAAIDVVGARLGKSGVL